MTTTLDTHLEAAIDAVRYSGAKTTNSLAYNPKRVEDLRENLRDMAVPTVYHLFGKPNGRSRELCHQRRRLARIHP